MGIEQGFHYDTDQSLAGGAPTDLPKDESPKVDLVDDQQDQVEIQPISPDWLEMSPEEQEKYEQEVEKKRQLITEFVLSAHKEFADLWHNDQQRLRALFMESKDVLEWYEHQCQWRRDYNEKYNGNYEINDLSHYADEMIMNGTSGRDTWSPARLGLNVFPYNEDFHNSTVYELIARLPNLSVDILQKIKEKADNQGELFSKVKIFFNEIVSLKPASGIKLLEIGGNAIAFTAQKLGAEATYFGCYPDMAKTDPSTRHGFYGTGDKLTLRNWQDTVPHENDFVITERVFSDPGTGVAIENDHEMGAADLTTAMWNCTRNGGYAIHNDTVLLDRDYLEDIGWKKVAWYRTNTELIPDSSWYQTGVLISKKSEPIVKGVVVMPSDHEKNRESRGEYSDLWRKNNFDAETHSWKSLARYRDIA